MKQEALNLALEALETELSIDWTNNDEFNASAEKMYKAIAAIKEALAQPERDYERGFIDGMQKQMQSSVDKAVNRMAQPEQEPSGHFLDFAYSDSIAYVHVYDQFRKGQQFYKAPPQRTWVGLEGEEIRNLWEEATKPDRSTMTMVTSFAKAIEAKLKEKSSA